MRVTSLRSSTFVCTNNSKKIVLATMELIRLWELGGVSAVQQGPVGVGSGRGWAHGGHHELNLYYKPSATVCSLQRTLIPKPTLSHYKDR